MQIWDIFFGITGVVRVGVFSCLDTSGYSVKDDVFVVQGWDSENLRVWNSCVQLCCNLRFAKF